MAYHVDSLIAVEALNPGHFWTLADIDCGVGLLV